MTTEKRSNEAVCERSEVRTPAFWRVVRDFSGVRQYRGDCGWTQCAALAMNFLSPGEAQAYLNRTLPGERIVPVYHRVVKKPKSHGIGWAVARLKEGKRVRRREWGVSPPSDYVQLLFCQLMVNGGRPYELGDRDLFGQDWELAE